MEEHGELDVALKSKQEIKWHHGPFTVMYAIFGLPLKEVN